MSGEFDQEWWERTRREREQALWQVFGPSRPHGQPEGYVTMIRRKF